MDFYHWKDLPATFCCCSESYISLMTSQMEICIASVRIKWDMVHSYINRRRDTQILRVVRMALYGHGF